MEEALANTLRHAQARHAWVTLTFSERAFELCVRDDGDGAASANGANGLGQLGMRERVAMLEGDLELGPAAGGGYVVRARFPVKRR